MPLLLKRWSRNKNTLQNQNGFVNINTLSKEQLEVIVKFKKFADIKEYIEKRIAEL